MPNARIFLQIFNCRNQTSVLERLRPAGWVHRGPQVSGGWVGSVDGRVFFLLPFAPAGQACAASQLPAPRAARYLDIHLQDRCSMDQTVHGSHRRNLIGEDLAPVFERLVGGDEK